MQNRVGTLINKLAEQYQQQANHANLLTTAQMLVNELQQNVENMPATSSKVAVMIPSNVAKKRVQSTNSNTSNFHKEFLGYDIPDVFPVENLSNLIHHENLNTVVSAPVPVMEIEKEAPLAQGIELNDALGAIREAESLNDTLKEEQYELNELLHNHLVKDLRDTIGINDRFLLINELFRGDEIMYERSIKTINDFSSLEEAQYWINRELKVRHGWNDDNDISQLFDLLVKRRFS